MSSDDPFARLLHAATLEERPIRMLPWGRYGLELSIGDLNLFAAHPGGLKSTLACQIVAELTREGGTALMVTEEDAHKATRPRLRHMGADLDRIYFGPGLSVPEDLPILHALIERRGLDLIVADPLPILLNCDSNDNAEVRWRLQQLQDDVLAPYGVTLLGLMHLSKNTQRDTALGRMMGASTYGQLARQVYVLGRAVGDEIGDGVYVDLADEKHSYSALHRTVRHRVVPFVHAPRLVRLEEVGVIGRTASEVVTGKASSSDAVTAAILDRLSRAPVTGLKRTELVRDVVQTGIAGKTKVQSVIATMLSDSHGVLDEIPGQSGRTSAVILYRQLAP